MNGTAHALHGRLWVTLQRFTETATGRLLAGSVGAKAAVLAAYGLLGSSGLLSAFDTLATAALVLAILALLVRVWLGVRSALLWRVRRKLILSYIFIGFVPALLIVSFFLIAGLLLFFTIGSYMVESHSAAAVVDARSIAESTALVLGASARGTVPSADGSGVSGTTAALLASRLTTVSGGSSRGVSAIVVPADRCALPESQDRTGSPAAREGEAPASGKRSAIGVPLASAGPWTHASPPAEIPDWLPCGGAARLTTVTRDGRVDPVARAVAPIAGIPGRMVVVDIPLDGAFSQSLEGETGVRTASIVAVREEGVEGPPQPVNTARPNGEPRAPTQGGVTRQPELGALQWVAFVDAVDWNSGRARGLLVPFSLDVPRVYRRLTGSALNRIGDFSFGQLLLIGLGVMGGLFFVIQTLAFVMGMALARSVTGAVHELFIGTARVRRGDFNHKIRVGSQDQLGELASSFNSMTASIEDLLKEKAEKQRLEQELRIARGIQMSLLPQAPLRVGGVVLMGSCEPAREVGGDYYDYFAIDEDRIGLLIADVAGKGTSAALYMAELKGIVLSLSDSHHSPRQLLIEANRIISRHLDSRSFITMTYAVIDLRAQTFTHARAGHCPLMHLRAGEPVPRTLVPNGLVLGLQIDDGQIFARLLEESTEAVLPGDLFLLYTDGLSEAMDERGDFFGEARLGEAFVTHATALFADVGDRILRDVRAFAGTAPQHDDMTLLMIEVTAPVAAQQAAS
jgi:serine phosphatase RsbU (regulator of sigma subunit)